MPQEGYVKCPRCKGEGKLTEYGFDFDADGNKHWGDQTFKCPVCNGEGYVYDPTIYQLQKEEKPLPPGYTIYDKVRAEQQKGRKKR